MEHEASPELSQHLDDPQIASLPSENIDRVFSGSTIDLISAPLEPRILHISNEFFASASNLLTPTPPISKPGFFVETGAWYDGWETRRHNPLPSDDVIIRIGPAAGRVVGVEIDTAFFTGNHAPEVSVEGAYEVSEDADAKVAGGGFNDWKEVLRKRQCQPSRRHAWKVGKGAFGAYEGEPVTHVRLRMYPDGGIARFRLYGTALPIWTDSQGGGQRNGEGTELSAAVNGGIATACSDQHYGKPENLLLPGRGKDMGDGWETKRSRAKDHVDWAIVRLGARGRVSKVIVDTMHFRGNFPREVKIELGDFVDPETTSITGMGKLQVAEDDLGWVKVASKGALGPDTEFTFLEGKELHTSAGNAWTHAKLTMIPDGGVKRFRVFGTRV